MNAEFPRLITLLRKEKGISQKQAAAELGISQALLSHYEKGVRECGLDFLIRCSRFYHVSCDYLLGLSPERSGRQLTVEEIPEPENTKDTVFRGNIMPVLNKKLITNSLGIIYDLIGKSESKQLNNEISNYLMLAVYRAFRVLYSVNPKNEDSMFSVPQEMLSGYCSALMMMSEARAQQLAQGQNKGEDRVRNIDEIKITTEYLMQNYPKQSQALLNLIQNVEAKISGFAQGQSKRRDLPAGGSFFCWAFCQRAGQQASGSEMVTVVPSPSWLSSERLPPCIETISSATASPMPEPRRVALAL